MGGIHDSFLVGLGIHVYIAVVSHVYTCYCLLYYIVFFFYSNVCFSHQSVHALKI